MWQIHGVEVNELLIGMTMDDSQKQNVMNEQHQKKKAISYDITYRGNTPENGDPEGQNQISYCQQLEWGWVEVREARGKH